MEHLGTFPALLDQIKGEYFLEEEMICSDLVVIAGPPSHHGFGRILQDYWTPASSSSSSLATSIMISTWHGVNSPSSEIALRLVHSPIGSKPCRLTKISCLSPTRHSPCIFACSTFSRSRCVSGKRLAISAYEKPSAWAVGTRQQHNRIAGNRNLDGRDNSPSSTSRLTSSPMRKRENPMQTP